MTSSEADYKLHAGYTLRHVQSETRVSVDSGNATMATNSSAPNSRYTVSRQGPVKATFWPSSVTSYRPLDKRRERMRVGDLSHRRARSLDDVGRRHEERDSFEIRCLKDFTNSLCPSSTSTVSHHQQPSTLRSDSFTSTVSERKTSDSLTSVSSDYFCVENESKVCVCVCVSTLLYYIVLHNGNIIALSEQYLALGDFVHSK